MKSYLLFAIALLWAKNMEGQALLANSPAVAARLTAAFVAPTPIPPTIGLIVNALSNIDDRLNAVHSLYANLSREEINAFYSFLKSASSGQEKDISGLHALKNDILNVLRQQATPPPDFTQVLTKIYQDPSQDSVMRDYAIQHLVSWYEQGATDQPEAKEKIRAILHQATRETNSIAGTALVGMHRLSIDDSDFSRDEINNLALSLAVSAESNPATRLTAIQVCAERGIKAVLPAIESIPQTPGSLPMRLSAIAALGRLGGQQNTAPLRQLEAGQEETLRPALRAALRHLKEKEQLY